MARLTSSDDDEDDYQTEKAKKNNWSKKNLDDKHFSQIVAKWTNLKTADISRNVLQKLPDLTQCQAKYTLTNLNLSFNLMQILGDLSCLAKLEMLSVEYNMLTELDGTKLPTSLKIILARGNFIEEVGDLSHINDLEHLALDHNPISVIHLKNTDFSCWGLTDLFLKSEEDFQKLKSGGLQTVCLQYPPGHIFKKTYGEVQQFYQEIPHKRHLKQMQKKHEKMRQIGYEDGVSDETDNDEIDSDEGEDCSSTTGKVAENKKTKTDDYDCSEDYFKMNAVISSLKTNETKWFSHSYRAGQKIRLGHTPGNRSGAEQFKLKFCKDFMDVIELEEGEDTLQAGDGLELTYGSLVKPYIDINAEGLHLLEGGFSLLKDGCNFNATGFGTLGSFAQNVETNEWFGLTAQHVLSKADLVNKDLNPHIFSKISHRTLILSNSSEGLENTETKIIQNESQSVHLDIAMMKFSDHIKGRVKVESSDEISVGRFEEVRRDESVHMVGIQSKTDGIVTDTFGHCKFDNQIAYCMLIQNQGKAISEKGDSGSLIFNISNRAIGIVKGAKVVNGEPAFTVCCPLEWCLEALEQRGHGRYRLYRKVTIDNKPLMTRLFSWLWSKISFH